ncbi:EAL domain-containing response regulator [Paludibacterium paludis]|uniref:Transcriptional regulator n=1 Tax=Paludibacterium paludis TaxID=1225769 RepID=A0A918P5M6_9NEIS|nr:EAL domain-containing response regulator [Paludibacterium paludis]GGY22292.1 transcriptional regulator [Paludibacterium paludis]
MNDLSTCRICVLDDDPFMLSLLTGLLTGLGATAIETAASGLDVLDDIARGDAPELILADLNMPEMDGVEFVRKLAEYRYRGALIPVSGEDQRLLRAMCILIQAHHISVLGYLQKPVSRERLGDLLGHWAPGRDTRPETSRRSYSANRIMAAIRNGELVNHYQPKVELATGNVIGVETLVRWRHPQDGMVYPDQFIAVAEASGVIERLTGWVLNEALAQSRRWSLAGIDLRMAVNVSMNNLASISFTDFVTEEAQCACVPPARLVLEVTESRLMRDPRAPLEILTRLRLKRFGLSIDDFGTGHSSLRQLCDIPFDELKIDKSFVHRAWEDETSRAVVAVSQGLARQLGMKVVGEGVEDREDWDFLRCAGCDHAQGYFIARPMPAEEFLAWLGEWRVRVPALLAPSPS